MTKHTPGPWKVTLDPNDKSSAVTGPSDNLFEPICIIPHDDMCEQGVPEMKANAALIAAAPCLLAVLLKVAHELNAIRARDGAPQHISWDRGHAIQTDGCTHQYWDALTEECYAAIAKATGAV